MTCATPQQSIIQTTHKQPHLQNKKAIDRLLHISSEQGSKKSLHTREIYWMLTKKRRLKNQKDPTSTRCVIDNILLKPGKYTRNLLLIHLLVYHLHHGRYSLPSAIFEGCYLQLH